MTREHKLALIIGFSVFMVVGVLVGDYFSKARAARVDPGLAIGASPVPTPQETAVPLPIEQPGRITHAETSFPLPPVEIDMGPRPPLTSPETIGPGGIVGPIEGTIDQHGRITGITPRDPIAATPAPVEDTAPKYRVQSKDTLVGLAREKYGDMNLWTKLRDYNKDVLKGKDTLREGSTIRLPTKDVLLGRAPSTSSRSSAAPARNDRTTSVAPTTTDKTYTVKSGDSFMDISTKLFGTTKRWQEIAKLNPGVDSSSMRVGTVLRVPAK